MNNLKASVKTQLDPNTSEICIYNYNPCAVCVEYFIPDSGNIDPESGSTHTSLINGNSKILIGKNVMCTLLYVGPA